MQRVELLSQIEEQLAAMSRSPNSLGFIRCVTSSRPCCKAQPAAPAAPARVPPSPDGKRSWPRIPIPLRCFRWSGRQRASAAFLVHGVAPHPGGRRSTALICTSAAWRSCPRAVLTLFLPIMKSYIDPLILASVLPPRFLTKSFAVGTSEIFGQGFMLRLARSLRVVVVDPDANLIPAMRCGRVRIAPGALAHSLSRRRALD